MFLDDVVGPMSVKEAKRLSGADKFRKTISDIEAKHKPAEERYNRLKSDPEYREQEFQKWQKEVHGDKAVKEDSWHAGDNAWSSDNHEMVEGRLTVGAPVIVTAPNAYEGKTGEISEFSPSGKFVIVNLYNHGEHSMHLSDVEYNQYANDEDEGVEEGVVVAGPGQEVNDKTVRKMVWDILKINADTGEQAIQRALSVLARKPQSRSIQNLQDKLMDLKMQLAKNVAENSDSSPVAGAITRRILMQRLDLLKQYGPELVGAAVDNVADYVGDVEEIGSSDVSGWVAQVERMLEENPPEAFAEGWSDAMVARRTGQPRTPYSVYIKGRKWKDFESDDHAEAVANKLRAKFKADGRDPDVITIAPTDYEKDIKEMDKSQTPPGRAGDYPLGVKGTIGKPVTAKKVVKDLTKDLNQAFGKDKGIKEAGWDDAEATGKIPRQSMTESAETPSGQPTEIDPGKYYVWAWDGTVVVYGKYDTVQDAERNLPAIEQAAIKRVGSYVRGAFKVASGRSLSSKYLDKQGVAEGEGRVDPILIKALNRMPDGLATHGEVLNACYDAYAMELGRMEMKSNYGTTHAYVPQLMDLYKQKHGLTFNEAGNPAQQAAIAIAIKKDGKKPEQVDEFAPGTDRGDDEVPDQILKLANRWWNAGDKQPQITSVLRSLGWTISQVESEDDAVQMTHDDGTTYFISADDFDPEVFEDTGSWIVYDPETKQIKKRFKTHTAGKSYAQTHNLGFASSEYYFDNIKERELTETALNPRDPRGDYAAKRKALQDLGMNKDVDQAAVLQRRLDLDKEANAKGVAEAETDFSKRRKRERDVDAGRPVKPVPKNSQTDYARKRARDRKEMELGESYWTKLQRERSTKLNTLVNELKETIK